MGFAGLAPHNNANKEIVNINKCMMWNNMS